jgi:hypothetical protein
MQHWAARWRVDGESSKILSASKMIGKAVMNAELRQSRSYTLLFRRGRLFSDNSEWSDEAAVDTRGKAKRLMDWFSAVDGFVEHVASESGPRAAMRIGHS